ncbi:hypothetical protein [Echinicola vietnamensis]|uniref:Uncharacterized protein n=1 Tax=Echinicola vietnamensis (strain DSM 17526 / LMG 23754 / KMM 6221) TaxID=926556 RepID=L0G2V2_ECHVK|nr:hypothetical protein [Echinicola vietnamensis]AGA79633.1 hypothetical protein Echvi_3413 [Echinicola vietnamensis DSM 17526]
MLDTVSLVFVVVMIIAFAIPFVIHHKKNTRRQAQAKARMSAYARMHNLSFHFMEIWRNQYFLGMDEEKCKLVYIEDIAKGDPFIIDLHHVNGVHVDEKSRRIKSQGDSRGHKIIDQIDLILESEIPGQRQKIEIYDGEKFSCLINELVLANTWEQRIRQTIIQKSLKVQE